MRDVVAESEDGERELMREELGVWPVHGIWKVSH